MNADLLDIASQSGYILPFRPKRSGNPGSEQSEADPADPLRSEMKLRREDQQCNGCKSVAEFPDHSIDERLDLNFDIGRQGKVQKLNRRCIDRITENSVTAAEYS